MRIVFEFNIQAEILERINKEMKNPEFWSDKIKASEKIKELTKIKENLKIYEDLKHDLDKLNNLLKNENLDEIDFRGLLSKIVKNFKNLETEVRFAGKYDKNNALITIYSGAGGIDAQDWAMMLLRMYQKYSEKAGWKWILIDQTSGERGGIKKAVLEILGKNAYGRLKKESGVHRLVRISPFSAKGLRHTSFALVEVLPEIEDVDGIEIREKDIKIETFRASGPGGQYLQKTESAVRITHLPTKITVSVQSERSQYQNKLKAMKILKSRLISKMEEEMVKEISKLKPKLATGIEWANQIRSYVLDPYKLVKDIRTGVEIKDVDSVLDGNLDKLIEAELKIN